MNRADRPRNRWRPKFSLRSLAIIVTTLCCYAASWGPTKNRGVVDVVRYVKGDDSSAAAQARINSGYLAGENPSAIAPLIVGVDQYAGPDRREYYFWCFGFVAKLPIERPIDTHLIEEYIDGPSEPL